MSRLLQAFLVVAISALCINAQATSRAKVDGSRVQDSITAYCAIEGEFVAAEHTAERVTWAIEIATKRAVAGGTCPPGARLDLAIRGAEFVANLGEHGQYVYPVHVSPPKQKQRVVVQAYLQHVKVPRTGREYSEWLVTDWDDGFKAQD